MLLMVVKDHRHRCTVPYTSCVTRYRPPRRLTYSITISIFFFTRLSNRITFHAVTSGRDIRTGRSSQFVRRCQRRRRRRGQVDSRRRRTANSTLLRPYSLLTPMLLLLLLALLPMATAARCGTRQPTLTSPASVSQSISSQRSSQYLTVMRCRLQLLFYFDSTHNVCLASYTAR